MAWFEAFLNGAVLEQKRLRITTSMFRGSETTGLRPAYIRRDRRRAGLELIKGIENT
jgi:hypothetical protein